MVKVTITHKRNELGIGFVLSGLLLYLVVMPNVLDIIMMGLF